MLRTGILIGAVALTACATTGKRRVVNIADAPTVTTQSVRYDAPEAQAACDTRKMRKRALDSDPLNDTASITVVREVAPGRRLETDIDVDCREFFASRLGGTPADTTRAPKPETRVIVTQAAPSAPAPVIEVRTQPAALTYRVRRGDTLFDIARQHCTGWKTVAAENGLHDASRIKPGMVLRIPGGGC